MKKWLGLLLLVLFTATVALADPVPVTVNSMQVLSQTGPYQASITDNTGTSIQPVICFEKDNNIGNLPWSGLKYTINTVGGAWDGLTTFDFNVLGYLADQLFTFTMTASPSATQIALQDAIWAYTDYVEAGRVGSLSTLELAAIGAVNGGYITSDFFLINPNASPGVGNQPLIEKGPEPGSLLLLGTGILTMAGAVRRRLGV